MPRLFLYFTAWLYLGQYCFFFYIVTYLCSLCSVWWLFQVLGCCMLCKLPMSCHSTQSLTPDSLDFPFPLFFHILSSIAFSPLHFGLHSSIGIKGQSPLPAYALSIIIILLILNNVILFSDLSVKINREPVKPQKWSWSVFCKVNFFCAHCVVRSRTGKALICQWNT